MASFSEKAQALINVHNEISTVNSRIHVTLFVVVCTAGYYFITGRVPADSWLFFLAAMSGLDVSQYYAKRRTFTPNGSSAPTNGTVGDGSTASTDVQEISQTVSKG